MSQSTRKTVVIVGGHGNVALHLAKQLSSTHKVLSIIRDPSHEADITATGASPLVVSLENDSKDSFTALFEKQSADVVVFSAGAGGKGGEERTKKVDYEGAVKIFDAIEGCGEGKRPRLILVSAVDVRDPEKIPAHYTEEDKDRSEKTRKAISAYMKWKYEADKDLVKRTNFKWTILRPGGLSHESGTKKVSLGITHITTTIPREDVASTLALLVDRPDAAGLALDVVGGDEPLGEALDKAIKERVTAWIG